MKLFSSVQCLGGGVERKFDMLSGKVIRGLREVRTTGRRWNRTGGTLLPPGGGAALPSCLQCATQPGPLFSRSPLQRLYTRICRCDLGPLSLSAANSLCPCKRSPGVCRYSTSCTWRDQSAWSSSGSGQRRVAPPSRAARRAALKIQEGLQEENVALNLVFWLFAPQLFIHLLQRPLYGKTRAGSIGHKAGTSRKGTSVPSTGV